LSIPFLLLSRTASTAAAALDVGGLEMGVVVGNRLDEVEVVVELEVVWLLLEVVVPVVVAPVAPVVVWLEVVVPVVVLLVSEVPSSVYSDPQ
jgi:hypothetical protein